ncbi:MAG: vanadium-dependent haloperoxidase, partial [Devosia sp.]
MMQVQRRGFAAAAVATIAFLMPVAAWAASPAQDVLRGWYDMALLLTRHTPTFSPPVASRAYGYIGVVAYEAVASGSTKLLPLAGQLNGLTAAPAREAGAAYDEAVVLDAAMAGVMGALFSNTGPTGHRAMEALEAKLRAEITEGLA